MPTKSCSKNFIDDSMSRLPARYSVVVVFFFFIYRKLCFIRMFGVFQSFVVFVLFFYLFVQFVSKSMDEVDSEIWTCSLGAEMTNQIPLYTNLPEEKVCRPII